MLRSCDQFHLRNLILNKAFFVFLFYRDRMGKGNDPHPTGILCDLTGIGAGSRETRTDCPLVQIQQELGLREKGRECEAIVFI